MSGASIPLPSPSFATTISKEGTSKPASSRVLVLGGTGRVGGSTATALSKLCPDFQIKVSGRNRERGAALVSKLGQKSEFVELDINNRRMLEQALEGVDLVVHTAGPFQRNEKCTVLEAAISTKTAYIDVCDDTEYSWRAKGFHNEAVAAGIPAITTAGIYPGVSNVMAAELVHAARTKDEAEPERLRFFYYTAGTGGAGPTILATSLLLLGEDVIAYNKGEEVRLKPYSGALNIDFGKGVRTKDVYLLNLPEVKSVHKILKVPSVSARFGTAPFFWNWGMLAFAKFIPMETFRDKNKVMELVELIDPVVRAVDGIAGERMSMRVDLECTNGKTTIGLFTHKKLSVSVGYATAAFVLAVLEGSTQPGVWFPEEPEGISIEARKVLLERATQGTSNFVMHKPPWMVETTPKEVGLGIYV
ncbi:Saccharopine dehydrogenase NADP binding domain-containing protein [Carex littledalei]|uniref:Saccharopine dehydrogenase NADP binding domain-containing protein n=1 Tax=Carex littledalei TaxID=544730 RepID=A0A833QQ12_9POAL|nr:Saccharopine dehydrogenase NADP binding domain-containing protein [Carex littledalei]